MKSKISLGFKDKKDHVQFTAQSEKYGSSQCASQQR